MLDKARKVREPRINGSQKDKRPGNIFKSYQKKSNFRNDIRLRAAVKLKF